MNSLPRRAGNKSQTSRQTILLEKSKQNVQRALLKFDGTLSTTLSREGMKKFVAMEEASNRCNDLSRVRRGLESKLRRRVQGQQTPVSKLKQKNKDITIYKQNLQSRAQLLTLEYRQQKQNVSQLTSLYDQLKTEAKSRLSSAEDLDMSIVYKYIADNESRTKQTVRLQHLIRQQVRQLGDLQRLYNSRKQQVQRAKQILSTLNPRAVEPYTQKNIQEKACQVSQNQAILARVQALLNLESL